MLNKILQKKYLLALFLLSFGFIGITKSHAETKNIVSNGISNQANGIYLPIMMSSSEKPTPDPTPQPTLTPPPPGQTKVYYISPNGYDNRSGLSESEAWATFNHAWHYLYPGDTLILLDGTYYQTLAPNVRDGTENFPITVKALHDGKAIIDGQKIAE